MAYAKRRAAKLGEPSCRDCMRVPRWFSGQKIATCRVYEAAPRYVCPEDTCDRWKPRAERNEESER